VVGCTPWQHLSVALLGSPGAPPARARGGEGMGRGTGMGIDTGGPAWSCVPGDVPGDASLSSACGRGGRDEHLGSISSPAEIGQAASACGENFQSCLP